ncbi:MAG TPA: IS110 family transposase [Gemmatimonadales bacterium]|jgi:transposase|nr:IS110 family transposase [Gemmatimonadales bacterium]
MWYVGLDIHQRRSSICILSERGERLRTETVVGPWSKLLGRLRAFEEPFAVCFEASLGYGHLYEQLSAIARRVAVAHPGHLRLIFRSKRKNDRVDAEKLAKLLYLDEVPTVHVPTLDVRSWRSLVEHRQRIVAERTRCKNSLRALLRAHGIAQPKGLWSGRGLAWLRSVELTTDADRLRRDLTLEALAHGTERLRTIESHLGRIGASHPGVALLMTIPGVGACTASAVVAYIDDPRRFPHNRAVGRYFGVVPTQDASGAVNRLGHISREGPSTVRLLITEAAWHAARRSPTVKAYFRRVLHGDPGRRKIALVATGHYLLRVMHAMLRDGTPWNESEPAAGSAAA